jgi:hypothetical protein
MSNSERPYSQMLLDGIISTQEHIIEWGHRQGVTDEEALAAGWIASMLAETHASLSQDAERLAMMDQLGPVLIAAIREARKQRETREALSDG